MTKYLLLSILFTLCLRIAYCDDTDTASQPELIRLTEDNFVVIKGQINGKTKSTFITELMNKKVKDLYVYISSHGGSVVDGMQIVQTLQAVTDSGVEVHCIADVAISMGFVIFQYCSNRYVMLSSIIMQHQMSLGFEGSINNINAYMTFINSMDDQIEAYQAARIGLPLADFRAKIASDWWLYGNTAVKEGTADKLVRVVCDFKHEPVSEIHQTFFGDVTITYSKCPIARDPLSVVYDTAILPEQKILVDELLDISFPLKVTAMSHLFIKPT